MSDIIEEKATNRVGFRVTNTLKKRIEKRAKEEGRTPSNLLINIITQYLDKVDEAKELLK